MSYIWWTLATVEWISV